MFESNREIGKTLLYEYERVNIDLGKMDKNMDLVKKYGARVEKEGLPFLTVLDAGGQVIANQGTGALEEGDHHDPAKVQEFLNKWTAQPENANSLFDQAIGQAAKEGKKVFLSFGAPWCPYCHKLDDFMAREDIGSLMGKDFVILKIDVDRMEHAEDIVKRYQVSERGGLPWFVVIDAQGSSLSTSFGPKGNVGYPVEPFEIAHFVELLTKTKKQLTNEDIRKIETALMTAAKELKRG